MLLEPYYKLAIVGRGSQVTYYSKNLIVTEGQDLYPQSIPITNPYTVMSGGVSIGLLNHNLWFSKKSLFYIPIYLLISVVLNIHKYIEELKRV